MILKQFDPTDDDLELGLIDIVMLFKNKSQARKAAAVLGPLRMSGLLGQISRMAVDSTAIDYLKAEDISFTVIDSFTLRLARQEGQFYPGVPWLWGWTSESGRAWVRYKPEFFWDEA